MKKAILSYNLDVQFISAGKAKSISIYLNPSYQIHLKAFFYVRLASQSLRFFFPVPFEESVKEILNCRIQI